MASRSMRILLGAGLAGAGALALRYARTRGCSAASCCGPAPECGCRGDDAAASVTIAARLYAPEPAAAALRLRGLARALAAAGAQVRVETSTPPGLEAPDDNGIKVISRPALRDENGYILGYAQYMSFDVPLLFRLLCGPKPKLYIAEPPPTTGMVTRLASALRGVPYAYYAADIWSDAARSTGAPAWVCKALQLVESHVLRHAHAILAVSDGVAQRVTELGATAVRVVPNGIDTDTFTHQGPVATEAPGEPYFLYAGTASQWQGAGIFIEALRLVHAEYPQARLVFLGQGSDWEHLIELADSDPRIELHGLVEPEEAAAWQRGAVASVVSIRPGQGYDFAYPTKIFAALACGTPVLYAGLGPAREDIPAAELGWAVDYEVRAVARAMLDALVQHERADDAARQASAERLRSWVLEHRSMQTELAKAAQFLLHG